MTDSQLADRAEAETAAGAVQGGGEQDATKGPGSDVATGEPDEGGFDRKTGQFGTLRGEERHGGIGYDIDARGQGGSFPSRASAL